MSNSIYARMKRHNEELADYLVDLECALTIARFNQLGFTGTAKRTDRALIKAERFRDEPHVLEYLIDPTVLRLLDIKFFDPDREWKPGQRREILNAFKSHFVEGAPSQFIVRLIAQSSMGRVNLDLMSLPEFYQMVLDLDVKQAVAVILIFESANDAMLYKLWKK